MNTYPFERAEDGAHRPIRGLWIRNGSFYVQTTVRDAQTGVKKVTRLRLPNAKTASEAKSEAAILLSTIAANGGTVAGKQAGGPTFAATRERYLLHAGKAPKTMKEEGYFLAQWERFLGKDCRITSIDAKQVLSYRQALLGRGCANRTANLHIRALRQMLRQAQVEGDLVTLPTDGINKLREVQTEKQLCSVAELNAIRQEAIANHPKTGQMFADFVGLLMFSGGRLGETLNLQWQSVDFDKEILTFVGTKAKSGKTRHVQFNPALKAHLLDMFARKTNEQYLYCSPRTPRPVAKFNKILNAIRAKLNLPHFTFHSTRHFFISNAVMRGIDYLTIAKWVGHADGGVLIGRVYGHLNAKHIQDQADKLTFAL